MTVKITEIGIQNFRSIKNLTISSQQLTVLVGKNDSGKSNVLRALNLFFNGETDAGKSFQFEVDHNIFNQPNRKAKEIRIQLRIELPYSYRDTNGDFVVWEKRWRTIGLEKNEYYGERKIEELRGGIRFETVSIPNKSNVHALLRNIRFIYVPAIKDSDYFSKLRASIYEVISKVADQTFRNSSQSFEQSISEELKNLTGEIKNSLGVDSRLALPRDLSHIFESLDFLSEGQNISLDARGDGIKARHIPLILKFMADKMHALQRQGAPPHSFIWGYEEPENSLELPSCVELANQFIAFLNKKGINQIFLTTHSPVFYNLQDNQGASNIISCYHIHQDSSSTGTTKATKAKEVSNLDVQMGAMTLLAPEVKGVVKRIHEQAEAQSEAKQLARARRRKLFVEGSSDKSIIKKALIAFAPHRVDEIDIETRNHGAGHNYVIDMLDSWVLNAKHTPDVPKAVGLVDGDARKKARERNNKYQGEHAKCVILRPPQHIIPALNAGYKIPVVLETFYDREAWEWAENHGHLIERDIQNIQKIIPERILSSVVLADRSINDELNPSWAIYVLKKFNQEGKRRMARHFSQKPDEEFRQRLASLEQVVNEIVSYLFPEP